MPLELEVAAFESKRPELIEPHLGRFVVIRQGEVLGVYPTFADANAAGVASYGQEPFLVQMITTEDTTAQNPALYAGLISAHL